VDEYRPLLAGYLQAWGADVCTAMDEKEAATHLDGDLPLVTAIHSLSLPKWQGMSVSRHPAVLPQSQCTCNTDCNDTDTPAACPRGHDRAEWSRT
jgi:hypothetical protein